MLALAYILGRWREDDLNSITVIIRPKVAAIENTVKPYAISTRRSVMQIHTHAANMHDGETNLISNAGQEQSCTGGRQEIRRLGEYILRIPTICRPIP